MNKLVKYGQWAMVAGAAEGLGEAFCTRLAQMGKNLIMVDYQTDKLGALSEKLRATYAIETELVSKDLTDTLALSNLSKKARQHDCRLWCYIAAFGPVKPFDQYTEEELSLTLELNAKGPLHLAKSFVELCLDKEPAGFMTMSSLSGMRGTQLVAPYAATKAFDWNLMEGLHHEYRNTNLHFTTACAGPILTPKYISTSPKAHFLKPKERTPDFVAKEVLENFDKETIILPGIENRIGEFILNRLLHRNVSTRIANYVM
ncbi:MAG: SDR family NAD(P)-dependent oxidoreductase, partial [Bacteroidota bacterium]